MDSVNGVTLQITVQMGIVTIIHNNHPILIWLPAWNMAFIFHYIWDLTNKNGDIYIYIYIWLVVQNMIFMTFHSVGNFIMPTDELHHFSEG